MLHRPVMPTFDLGCEPMRDLAPAAIDLVTDRGCVCGMGGTLNQACCFGGVHRSHSWSRSLRST